MENSEVRKFLHELGNALNAAKINAYLLRRMHGDVLDRETVEGLESALVDAEQIVSELQRRQNDDLPQSKPVAVVTN
jgi:hypothetical protein